MSQTWLTLAAGVLKIVAAFMSWMNERRLIKAGQDRAVAEAALQVLEATEYGKAIRARIREMDEASKDELWRRMLGA